MKKIWEWLKANWKWLLFPIGIALFLLGRFGTSRPIATIDPVKKADERAKVEAARREDELDIERNKLRQRLAAVHEEHQRTISLLTKQQIDEAAELEADPEKLNAWLNSL